VSELGKPAGLKPGLAGGASAIAVTLLLRSELGTKLLAEIVVDASTYSLQPEGFSFFLALLGAFGKPLLFASVLLGQLALFAFAWRQRDRFAARFTPAQTIAIAAVFTFIVLTGISAAFVLATVAGLGSRTTWTEYLLVTAVASSVFGLVGGISEMFPASMPTPSWSPRRDRRREFLAQLPGLVIGGVAFLVIGRFLLKTVGGGVQAGSSRGVPTPEVTSNDDFYIVSKNLIDPEITGSKWRLRVGGAARAMLELTLDDVIAMPSRDQYTTLQCISNDVGGDLISTAKWTGFPLRDLLAKVTPLPSAKYAVFRSDDDYTESLPLDFAMRDGVMLAYRMNDEALPTKHGYPLRLLAPGKYGIKNAKWITEIALMDEETFGYWQQRYWTQEARMNTSSRIDVPVPRATVSTSPYRLHGLAFSGDRGISRVEVSTDGGDSWQEAIMKPALSPYTWVLWYYDWRPSGDGDKAVIFARATDGVGNVQTARSAPPHPSGATGYPRVQVTVRTGTL
jgi:DMSO/TMAO reductase YedYZ molybdopterin-dependent catalytic subunit